MLALMTTTNYTMNASEYAAIAYTEDQQRANYGTHCFDWQWMRCMNCDCRPGGVWSKMPCGIQLPDHVAPWGQQD